MAGESKQYIQSSAIQKFTVYVNKITLDTLIGIMEIRYFSSSKLLPNDGYLQLNRFYEEIPEEAFTKLVEQLASHDETITKPT